MTAPPPMHSETFNRIRAWRAEVAGAGGSLVRVYAWMAEVAEAGPLANQVVYSEACSETVVSSDKAYEVFDAGTVIVRRPKAGFRARVKRIMILGLLCNAN